MAKPWHRIALIALAPLWAGLAVAKPGGPIPNFSVHPSPLVNPSHRVSPSQPVDRSQSFDRPGDEDDLNREIWQLSGRRDYERLIAKLRQAQRHPATPPILPLPNGWRLAPAGQQVEVGRLPYEALIYQGRLVVINSGYTGKAPQTLSVINPSSGRLERTIPLQNLYPSGAVGMDGDLYISGGFGREILRLDPTFQVRRRYPIGGYGGPIAALDPTHLVVGYLLAPQRNSPADGAGRLVVLNTESGQVELQSSGLLFPTAIHVLSGKIYATTLGDQRIHSFDRQLHALKQFPVGAIPRTSCSDGLNLYTVNSGSDSLSVLNSASDTLAAPLDLRFKGYPFGSSPTACSLDRDSLYVSQADINAIAVIDRATGQHRGFIPTGWYPTKVLSEGPWLFSLNAKGIRPRRPNPLGPGGDQYVLALLQGTAGILAKASIRQSLPQWTKTVETGSPLIPGGLGLQVPIRHIFYIIKENRTYDQVLGDLIPGNGDPSLTLFGEAITPNHHKLARQFVTLDNTYVNGEISVLGHSFTTSGYASPFLELIGNLSYSGRLGGYPFGLVPATFSPTYFWNGLNAKGLDYRIYGEPYYLFTEVYRLLCHRYGPTSPLARRFYGRSLELSQANDRGRAFNEQLRALEPAEPSPPAIEALLARDEVRSLLSEVFSGDRSLAQALAGDPLLRRQFAAVLSHYSFRYRPYDLTYSDIQRAQDWQQDFKRQLARGRVVPFSYIWLPNDHTGGANPKLLTPSQYLAQNDAALGEIVATISQSPIWKDSLVVVIEDDAQNGPDHVDATRTVAFAAGPHVRRGAVVSDRYDQLSLLRTMGLLLGLPPLNLGEGLAAPMLSIFTPTANLTPYQAAPASRHLHPKDRALLEAPSGAGITPQGQARPREGT